MRQGGGWREACRALVVLNSLGDGDEDALVAALDEAIAARLLIEVSAGEYRFALALVRSTLYDELSLTARVRLHRRVGLALESLQSERLRLGAGHDPNRRIARGVPRVPLVVGVAEA